MAIEEGPQLALHWTSLKFTVESNCAEAVDMINGSTPNVSAYAFRIYVNREFLQETDVKLIKISREANMVGRELAKLERVQNITESWFIYVPREISTAVQTDCNSLVA
jgi:hypothetical protein